MHHLLVTIGSHGDTHPFLGIGALLRQRGHRVTLAANEMFEPLARGAGLEFAALGTAAEYREALKQKDLFHPLRGFKTVFETGVLPLMRPAYDIIRQHYVPGETVVTAHAIAFGARIAQEKLGVPLVTIHLSPAVMRSAIEPPVFAGMGWVRRMPKPIIRGVFRFLDRAMIDRVIAKPVNAFRRELGLVPVTRIIDNWWMSPRQVIGLWPQWFGPPQVDWPRQVRLTGFPLYDERGVETMSAEMTAFLKSGLAPIAFTFGSAMTHAREIFQTSAEACHRMGRRGLLLTRFTEQVPANLPAGVRHFDYAPFSELLPHCAALVHHGGIGTTAQALAAGVPQLITPFAHDQHDNAARVKRLGVGEALPPGSYRPKKLAAVLDRLLGDRSRPAQCRRVAEKFVGKDALGATCDAIEEVATKNRITVVAAGECLNPDRSPVPSRS